MNDFVVLCWLGDDGFVCYVECLVDCYACVELILVVCGFAVWGWGLLVCYLMDVVLDCFVLFIFSCLNLGWFVLR